MASLWDLDNEASVTFTKNFYQHLGQPNINRAESLRLAQLALLKNVNYNHPYYLYLYVPVCSWLIWEYFQQGFAQKCKECESVSVINTLIGCKNLVPR
ncbi:CHAT domain-containing protein [Trichormus azollae]|uniref:CHAT domain-containing protein n=1 Tax=Trichormus azollae TaxID=1164 RepID=UPI003D34D87B